VYIFVKSMDKIGLLFGNAPNTHCCRSLSVDIHMCVYQKVPSVYQKIKSNPLTSLVCKSEAHPPHLAIVPFLLIYTYVYIKRSKVYSKDPKKGNDRSVLDIFYCKYYSLPNDQKKGSDTTAIVHFLLIYTYAYINRTQVYATRSKEYSNDQKKGKYSSVFAYCLPRVSNQISNIC